jgi:AhpD family alkylhydroperoxidase
VTAPAARIAPGSAREAGPLAWLVATVGGRLAGTEPMNLFLTLGRHRRLFRAWLRFGAALMPRGVLPRRESELVILRVAQLRDCEYERVQHVRIGLRSGLDAADIERVAGGPAADGWSAREHAILTAVDALHETGDLDDATWAGLREHLDDRECIELCLLAGHYEMLATAITALRIQPEARRR